MGFFGKKNKEEPEGFIWHDEGSVEVVNGSGSVVVWDETCAWCLAERGIVSQSGSHGICARHEQAVYQSYRAGHRGRRL
jgi:hypothetical protein